MQDGGHGNRSRRTTSKEKATLIADTVNTFEAIARRIVRRDVLAEVGAHIHRSIKGRLENDLIPWLGTRPIRSSRAPEILETARIAARGAEETRRRALQDRGRVFAMPLPRGGESADPSRDRSGALARACVKELASITNRQQSVLCFARLKARGAFPDALRLTPGDRWCSTRPGELRMAEKVVRV